MNKTLVDKLPPSGEYLSGRIPEAYACSSCGATGCKLWRQYNTAASCVELLCAPCAARDQGKDVSDMGDDGCWGCEYKRSDQIGWLVPAVPCEGCDTYWGYASVPRAGVAWWRALPSFPTERRSDGGA